MKVDIVTLFFANALIVVSIKCGLIVDNDWYSLNGLWFCAVYHYKFEKLRILEKQRILKRILGQKKKAESWVKKKERKNNRIPF